MKKFLMLAIVAMFFSAVDASAQYYFRRAWYVTPTVSYVSGDNVEGMSTALTFGRYLDRWTNFSIEGTVSYVFDDRRNDQQAIHFMVSYDDYLFRSRYLYGGAGIGLGILTNGLTLRSSYNRPTRTDAVMPLKVSAGFNLGRNLSFGVHAGYMVNLSYVDNSLFTFGGTMGVRF